MSESFTVTRAEASYTLDEEEAAIRANIELIERQLTRVVEESYTLKSGCKDQVEQLISLKKNEQQVHKEFHDLHSQTAVILKQRQRRYERARAISQKIESVERKKEQLHFERETVNYSIYSRIYHEQQSITERRSQLLLMREKHKLVDQSNKEQILSLKRQLYLDCKRRQAELMRESVERNDINGDEKRKKHLEVLYQEKMTILAKEIAKKKKLEALSARIEQEKAAKAKAAEETAKRLERLARYNSVQREALLRQREQETRVVDKYKETFLPKTVSVGAGPKPGRKISQVFEELTAKGRKGSTNIEMGRASSLDGTSKADHSVVKSQRESKDSELPATQLKLLDKPQEPKSFLMTSIDVPANRSSNWKVSRPTSGNLGQLKKLPNTESKLEMSTAKQTPIATRDISRTHIYEPEDPGTILPKIEATEISIGANNKKPHLARENSDDGREVARRVLPPIDPSRTREPPNTLSEGSPIHFSLGPINRVDLPRSLVDPETNIQRAPRIFNIETRDTAADLENAQNERLRHLDTTQLTADGESLSRRETVQRIAPFRGELDTSLATDLGRTAPQRPVNSETHPPAQAAPVNLELELKKLENSRDSDPKGHGNLQQQSLDSADSSNPKPAQFVSFGGSKITSSRGIPAKLELQAGLSPPVTPHDLGDEF